MFVANAQSPHYGRVSEFHCNACTVASLNARPRAGRTILGLLNPSAVQYSPDISTDISPSNLVESFDILVAKLVRRRRRRRNRAFVKIPRSCQRHRLAE